IAGISLCGLFAAIISTGPLNFLAPVQIFIRDVYAPYINPNASDSRLVLINRLAAVVLLIIGCIVATTFTEILQLTFWAFAFRGGIAVILLSLTYLGSRYVSESGAFWGLISGVVMFVIWTILGNPYNVHVAIPSMATCFVSTLVISLRFKRKQEFSPEVQEAMHPGKTPEKGLAVESR
ncbi:MAG: sodium:solute symporter family transporter, partial [Candidatus Latescibacterota bacterium]